MTLNVNGCLIHTEASSGLDCPVNDLRPLAAHGFEVDGVRSRAVKAATVDSASYRAWLKQRSRGRGLAEVRLLYRGRNFLDGHLREQGAESRPEGSASQRAEPAPVAGEDHSRSAFLTSHLRE